MPTFSPPSIFDGMDVPTLQSWLAQAQQAYISLSCKDKHAVEVVNQGDVVKYKLGDLDRLQTLISQLQAAIKGRPTAGAIGAVWSL